MCHYEDNVLEAGLRQTLNISLFHELQTIIQYNENQMIVRPHR